MWLYLVLFKRVKIKNMNFNDDLSECFSNLFLEVAFTALIIIGYFTTVNPSSKAHAPKPEKIIKNNQNNPN